MSVKLEMDVLGLDGIDRMLGLMQEAFDDQAVVTITTGIIRPTPLPGGGGNVMAHDSFTLERQVGEAFQNSGRTPLRAPWDAYSREPRYKRFKERRQGGDRVGIWEGSKTPLAETFLQGHPEHIEEVTSRGWRWGSSRRYAGTFHAGQPRQFLGEPQPPREVVVLDKRVAREAARAHLRFLASWLRLRGQGVARMRVNL
jgi:hypothetical protein